MSPPTQRLAPSSAFLSRLILLAVAINLVAAAIAFLSLYHSRERTVDEVRLTTANFAALAENNLSESARRIDLALTAIVDRLEHQLAEGRLTDVMVSEVLDTYRARLPEVDAFRAGLSDGVVRWGKDVDPAKPATWADRAFFAAHRAEPGQRLIVTEPIVGRVSKKWVVAFTRSYRKPDGGFGGVVIAAVPVDFFTRMLGEMKLGPNGSAVIRHLDRGLLTRYPPVDGPGGGIGDKTVSATFAGLLASGVARANFHVARAPDGVERSYAFQRVGGLPYVLIVGMAPRDYLAPWHDEVAATLGLLSVLILVSVIGATLVNRAWKDRLAAADAQAESESLYRHYIETAPEGIFVTDSQGRYVDVNPAGCALVGYSRDELLRMTVRDLAPTGAADEHGELYEVVKDIKNEDLEFTLRHKDGRLLDVILRSVVQPDGNVMGFCSDITARKQAEAVLANHRAELESLVSQRTADLSAANRKLRDTEFAMNSVGIGIHWVEPDTGRFIYVNRHAAEILGYRAEEMLELSVPDIDPNFPAEAFVRIREDIKATAMRGSKPQRARDGRLPPGRDHRLLPCGRSGFATEADCLRRRDRAAQGSRTRPAHGEGRGRGGQRGEERLPRQHEPRDPHADECHRRHEPSAAAFVADAAAARPAGQDRSRRKSPAGDHQRDPRPVEDRGRQVRPGRGGFRSGGAGAERGRDAAGKGRGQDLAPAASMLDGLPKRLLRRSHPAAAGDAQLRHERGEVHRAGPRGAAFRRSKANTPRPMSCCASRSRTPGSASTRPGSSTCSMPLHKPTIRRRGSTAAPAWAWRSRANWPR